MVNEKYKQTKIVFPTRPEEYVRKSAVINTKNTPIDENVVSSETRDGDLFFHDDIFNRLCALTQCVRTLDRVAAV